MSEGTRWGENWDTGLEESADLTSLSEDELQTMLADIVGEEQKLSCRRRILHGRIDLIRAELIRRGRLTLSPEELARVLMGADREGDEG